MTKLQLLDLLDDAKRAAWRAQEGVRAQQQAISARQAVGADTSDAFKVLIRLQRSCEFNFFCIDALLDQLDEAA